MTNQCCGLAVIFCGFIVHLIGHETMNIPEIFSGVHGFTGKTVKFSSKHPSVTYNAEHSLIEDNGYQIRQIPLL